MKRASSQTTSKHCTFGMWAVLVFIASLLSSGAPAMAQDRSLRVERVLSCKASQLAVSIPPPGPKTAGVVMQGAIFALWVTNRGTLCSVKGYPPFVRALVRQGQETGVQPSQRRKDCRRRPIRGRPGRLETRLLGCQSCGLCRWVASCSVR
jgi:hypothetical protein